MYFSGSWYPAGEYQCTQAIENHARETEPQQGQFTGLIGPHAGWLYSGKAAAQSYRWLAEANDEVDLVVVFGSHRGAGASNTIMRGPFWSTPLGDLVTAQDVVVGLDACLSLEAEPVCPRNPDNGVELHLPFVKHFFPKAQLLMLGVAAAGESAHIGRQVAQLTRELKRKTVFVGSTDLTHYGPNYDYEPMGSGHRAVKWVRHVNDRNYLDLVLASKEEEAFEHAMQQGSACCPGAVLACMSAVGQAMNPRLVSHYLSCDIQQNPSFVGYAGVVL
jgi:MEMO1 family protein